MTAASCPGDRLHDNRTNETSRLLLLRRLTLALVAMGVLWRFIRYLLRFPLWHDEAFICLNFLELDYLGLMHELRNCQVAPLLFLWGELTSLRLFGTSEWSMRLLPFLAGLGSLPLFWQLTRQTLPPLARTIAVGFLAVAIWPVTMGAVTKPYTLDLFMSLVLLLPASQWLQNKNQLRYFYILIVATPLALFGSYPAVFVAGAVSLSLFLSAWREGWKTRSLWLVYNLAVVAAFCGHYRIAGHSQLQTSNRGTSTELGMQNYWAEGFPPSKPLPLALWLFHAHTGQMLALPIGATNGGSTLTLLLSLTGLYHFWRSSRRDLCVLCVAPFAFGLLAAVLRKFPYGASGRLCQHLVPVICLSAGMGVAVLIERLRSEQRQRRMIFATCTLLLCIGVGGIVRDLMRPYHDEEAVWMRQIMKRFDAETRPDVPIVVMNTLEDMDCLLRWYLEQYGDRVSWGGRIDWEKAEDRGEIICLYYDYHARRAKGQTPLTPLRAPLEHPIGGAESLGANQQAWRLSSAFTDIGVASDWQSPVKHLHHMHWVRKNELAQSKPHALASK
jgi:hypothetical protein